MAKKDQETPENQEPKKAAVSVVMADGSTVVFSGRQTMLQSVDYELNRLTVKLVTGQIWVWEPNFDWQSFSDVVKKIIWFGLTNKIKYSLAGKKEVENFVSILVDVAAKIDSGEFVTRTGFGELGEIALSDIEQAWVNARLKWGKNTIPLRWGDCVSQEELAEIKKDWSELSKERRKELKNNLKVQEELMKIKMERGDLVDTGDLS